MDPPAPDLPPPDFPQAEKDPPIPAFAIPRDDSDRSGGAKVALNILAALGFTALAGWLLTADLLYPGNLIFQLSWSLPALTIFILLLGSATLLLAVFPKRIVVGASLLLICRGALGYPLSIWIDDSLATIALSAALLALALYYFTCSLRKLIRIGDRPWVHFPHTLALIFFGAILAILAIPITVLGYTTVGRNLMGDYIQITPEGLSLVERVLRKDGQRIHLVGMMHIGKGEFYDELKGRLAATPSGPNARRLVLTEGVSDEQKILPENFASGEIYARWAQFCGLEVQKSLHGRATESNKSRDRFSPDKRIHYRNADIDISELDPSHRDTLVTLLNLLDETDPIKLLLASPEGVTGPDIEELFFEGLLGDRNDALMKQFEQFGAGVSEVYIPWGAAHLTDIEQRFRELGYEQTDEFIHPIVSFPDYEELLELAKSFTTERSSDANPPPPNPANPEP